MSNREENADDRDIYHVVCEYLSNESYGRRARSIDRSYRNSREFEKRERGLDKRRRIMIGLFRAAINLSRKSLYLTGPRRKLRPSSTVC